MARAVPEGRPAQPPAAEELAAEELAAEGLAAEGLAAEGLATVGPGVERLDARRRGMEPNLFKYILQYSKRDQIIILIVVLLSQLFYFVSLDLPKRIVNEAIQGESFPSPEATQTFLAIRVPDFGLLSQPITLFGGFDLGRIDYLVALCFAFLYFVLVNGWFKL
jgi:hypothetical protein